MRSQARAAEGPPWTLPSSNSCRSTCAAALDAVMLAATHLGDLAIVWFLAAAVLAAQPKRRVYGIAVAVAVLATAALGMLVLKPLFGRVRPFEATGFMGLLIPPPGGSSFPSNHSMVSFAAATAICCLPKGAVGVTAAKPAP